MFCAELFHRWEHFLKSHITRKWAENRQTLFNFELSQASCFQEFLLSYANLLVDVAYLAERY